MNALLILDYPSQILAQLLSYFPNLLVAKNDISCTNNEVSTCCPRGSSCLGNGLYFDPNQIMVGGYIRGACKNHGSPLMAQYSANQVRRLQKQIILNSVLLRETYLGTDNVIINTISDAGILSCVGSGNFRCQSEPLTICNCQTGNDNFTLAGNLIPIYKY